MAAEASSTYLESQLNPLRLRELTRAARGGFAPDHVGLALRHRAPEYVEDCAEEIAGLLRPLADAARERLADAGLEPRYDEKEKAAKISKREREFILNIAAILTWLAHAEMTLGDAARGCEAALEGIAWSRLADDPLQQAILYAILSHTYQDLRRYPEEEAAGRTMIAMARAARVPEELARALHTFSAALTVRYRLDEAEELNREAMAIVKGSLNPEEHPRLYSRLLTGKARIVSFRMEHAEAIRMLREALRWADAATDPVGRATIFIHLGATYLRLEHFRQSVECNHEVVKLGEAAESNLTRSWGYFKLAESHLRLNELELTEEMLNRAEEYGKKTQRFILPLQCKRAQVRIAQSRSDEAAEILTRVLAAATDQPMADVELFAHRALAEIEERDDRFEEAIAHFRRAIEIGEKLLPGKLPPIILSMAEAYHRHGDPSEAERLLHQLTGRELDLENRARMLQLKASIAEDRGDLRAALDLAREAFTIERTLLERHAEQSLRNARIVAETDLLERDADLERERRRRVERELAEAVVQLGDRKRIVETVEQKLRSALRDPGADQERSMARAMRETLSELRSRPAPTASPLRYLSDVNEEFYKRLRAICPDLTPKQERLCGLLRAGLSSKDIATLLQLGPEGLKAQRKRLRKKLNLGIDERLEATLAEI